MGVATKWLQRIDGVWAVESQAFHAIDQTGRVREGWVVGEAGFTNLIARAGRAFVAAKGKHPDKEGAALAEYLRSDRPLGEDERQLLAQLVTGHWRNRTGRQKVSAGQPRVLEIVATLRNLEGQGWKKEAAKEQVASDFEVSRGTVENYEQMTVEREQLLAMLGPQTNK